MKRSFIVLCLMVLPAVVLAQDTTSKFRLQVLPYMVGDLGTASGIIAQIKLARTLFLSGGLKLHHNKVVVPKINNEKLHHRFYASQPIDRLGITAGLNRILSRKTFIEPLAFYDLSIFNMGARHITIPNDSNVNTNKQVIAIVGEYKNLYTFENSLGLGANAKIWRDLFLSVRGGISGNIITNLPANEYRDGIHFNLSPVYAIGLQYNFR